MPSKCTIVKAVGRLAYALEVLCGGNRAWNGDRTKKPRIVGAASTVENTGKAVFNARIGSPEVY